MKMTLALAALLAATAFTPSLAQDAATAAEPTPIPERVMVQMAQRERGDRGQRGDSGNNGGGNDAPRREWNGGQGRVDGGGQRPQPAAPVYQAPVYQAPTPQTQTPQAAPAQRQWNRGDGGGTRNWQGQPNWQGQQRPDGSMRNQTPQSGQQGWTRPTPPVATAPAQPQGNWQNREQRRDTWQGNGQGNGQGNRQGNGTSTGVGGIQRPESRNWNGQRRDGVQGNTGQWNGQRRNDSWQNNRRNDGQWNGNNGRNDTWRNDNWRNNGRNDSWQNNGRRYDQRSQWQNQYRDWNRNWSRDWRRDQRYDWQRYRYTNRGLFRNDRYYAPYGWDYGYRRFSIGFSLSYLLYDQQYWIDDPYSYRLPPVYGPYRWVRYYDDVLLVDLRSGQVVDAIHDFFE